VSENVMFPFKKFEWKKLFEGGVIIMKYKKIKNNIKEEKTRSK